MFFIILLSIVSLIIFGVGISAWKDSGFMEAVEAMIWTTILSGSVAALVFTGASVIVPRADPEHLVPASSTSSTLTALQTGTETQGSFFLGTGVVDGERVLNYIINENGAYTIESVNADRAKIYTDSTEPTLVIVTNDYDNSAFAPFPMEYSTTYEFHIPEDSVLSNYTIDNR